MRSQDRSALSLTGLSTLTLSLGLIGACKSAEADLSLSKPPPALDSAQTDDREPNLEIAATRRHIESLWNDFWSSNGPYPQFAPEYDNPLESLVVHLNPDSRTNNQVREQVLTLLRSAPEYTNIKVVMRSDFYMDYLNYYIDQEREADLMNRITLLSCEGKVFTPWARDPAIGDQTVQWKPLYYAFGGSTEPSSIMKPNTEIVDLLTSTGVTVRELPIYVQGGNQHLVRTRDGKKLVICGPDDYLRTKQAFNHAHLSMSEELFKSVLKRARQADEVIILGPRNRSGDLLEQPPGCFHLDQAMVFVADGNVVVTQVPISDETREILKQKGELTNEIKEFNERYFSDPTKFEMLDFTGFIPSPENLPLTDGQIFYRKRKKIEKLAEKMSVAENLVKISHHTDFYAKQLHQLGFTVQRVLNPERNTTAGIYYVNSMIFQHRDSGERRFLMPVFPNDGAEQVPNSMKLPKLQEKHFTESDRAAIKLFESLGLKVQPTRDASHRGNGNSHCLYRTAYAPPRERKEQTQNTGV